MTALAEVAYSYEIMGWTRNVTWRIRGGGEQAASDRLKLATKENGAKVPEEPLHLKVATLSKV